MFEENESLAVIVLTVRRPAMEICNFAFGWATNYLFSRHVLRHAVTPPASSLQKGRR
jgi:hypothetical protein